MCFSATASFVGGSALICAGAYVARSRPLPKNKTYLALVPIFFGIQQLSEGIVWLGVADTLPPIVQTIAAQIFSAFATTFWPIFIPFAMYHFEEKLWLKRVQLVLLLIGTILGLYLLYSSTIFSTLQIDVKCSRLDCHSLAYGYSIPYFNTIVDDLYLVPVILPFCFSQNAYVRYLVAPCFLFSFLFASYLALIYTFPSIWCFLAAIISTSIFVVIYKLKTPEEQISSQTQ